MIINIAYKNQSYKVDLAKPIDISITPGNVRCFYAPQFEVKPVVDGNFIGDINKGAPVNFYNVFINPHGNGTHTECLGHITAQQESINKVLRNFHFISSLITVKLVRRGDDLIISKNELIRVLSANIPEALVIRTLPNNDSKLGTDYSGTNPPYIEPEAMRYLVERGVKHLLIDLPSVDREEDNGLLASHHIFWGLAEDASDINREDCTITELIYVPDAIEDGLYLLNLMIAPLPLDASPSKPILYQLT